MKNLVRLFGILILLSLFSSQLHAQEGLKIRANKLFESLSYSEAISLYEQVVARDSMDSEALIRLADCYRLTNNMIKARDTYAKVVSKGFGEPLNTFYYAQALMNTGNHQDAIVYMEQYVADSRGANYLVALQTISEFYKDSANISVKKASFNSSQNDFSPIILPDQRVVFASSRLRAQLIKYDHSWTGLPFYYLYEVSRANEFYQKVDLFEPKLMKKYNNGPIAFNFADSSLMLTANNIGKKDSLGRIRLILKEYQYQPKKEKWNKKAILFPYNNDNYNTAHAAYSPDGKILFFSSDMPGTLGGMDLWFSKRTNEGWSSPVNLGAEINTPGNEVFPTITSEGFYYSSDGLSGLGGLDIFETDIDTTGIPVGKPANMGYPLNTGSDDFGLAFLPDLQKGFFASNRGDLNENDDIYEFQIVHKKAPKLLIAGIVRDKFSKEILPGSKVFLMDKSGKIIHETIADEKAAFMFEGSFYTEYIVEAEKDGYYDGFSVIEPVIPGDKDVIIRTILELEQNPNAVLIIEVRDEKTNELLPGTSLSYVSEESGDQDILITDEQGVVRIPLLTARMGSSYQYACNFVHPQYFKEDTSFHIQVVQAGEIRVIAYLTRMEVGMDLGKFIQINPIYFDLDKWNIRPDAAVELDKIVALMKEYPAMVVELGSHTDCRASIKYNERLSDRRAKSSAAYIVEHGIEKSRIYGKGYGETKLVNGCECEGDQAVPCSEEEHQLNRRTEFIIVKLE